METFMSLATFLSSSGILPYVLYGLIIVFGSRLMFRVVAWKTLQQNKYAAVASLSLVVGGIYYRTVQVDFWWLLLTFAVTTSCYDLFMRAILARIPFLQERAQPEPPAEPPAP